MIYTAALMVPRGTRFMVVEADDFDQAATRALAATAADLERYHVDGVPDTSELRLMALIEGDVPTSTMIAVLDN